jgi:hypothetical protein
MHLPALLPTIALCLLAASGLGGTVEGATGQSDADFFEISVRPLLSEQCYSCHSQKSGKSKGGLRVDSLPTLLKGGETGPALVPGKPDTSLMIKAVSYQDADLQMPPKKRLGEQQVAIFREWITRGAYWPAGSSTGSPLPIAGKVISSTDADHWAWAPIRAGEPPHVSSHGWGRSPIDRFVLAKLEANDLHPAPEADRRTLARRASFAVTGLPLSSEQIEAFIADQSSDAYEKLVDSLLASPSYGERWARHWLDLVRYGESRGHEFDLTIPNAWQYRDYVIRALNSDLPYNEFVREQIAGDLLAKPRLNPSQGFNESIIGTGFWFLGEGVHSPVDIRQDEADRLDNMVDVSCKTFLGLTVGCARCHDHKFDPILTRDYYALDAFIQSSSYRLVRFESLEHNREVAARLQSLRRESDHALRLATAAALAGGVAKLRDYLLASLEAPPSPSDSQIAAIADAHHLEHGRLAAWCAHLGPATAGQHDDPFSVLAAIRQLPAAERQPQSAALAAGRAGELDKAERDFAAAVAACTTLVSYADPHESWIPDDVSYGAGAAEAGSWSYGPDAAQPHLILNERAEGCFDPLWRGLGLAGDSALDVGALNYLRAGRTLRTRNLTLGDSEIRILLRGKGAIYAAVDSHYLINGPLHGSLVQHCDGKTPGWHWIGMDLRSYAGHLAHFEFTAEQDDFAVALLLQGASPPPPPPPRAPLAACLRSANSCESLAGGLQTLMEQALAHVAGGQGSDGDAGAWAALANWLLAHPALVGAADSAPLHDLGQRQAEIAKGIQEKSHLAMAMLDGTGVDGHVYIRGSSHNLGAVAPRRLPESIFGADQPAITSGSGRLEWADRLLSPSDPFVPRVIVNRVWHHLIGRGIVASVDNLGALGERPTHPELLDYLAQQFVNDGWSIKRLIRSILCSSTFRMSSAADGPQDAKDPDNRLLHRAFIRRLEGEAIRDEILGVSGRLDAGQFGPPVPIHLTDSMQGRGRPESGPLDGNGRRSIYLSVTRNFLSPMMLAFDTPIPFNTMGRRASSNVPAQALALMNDPFVIQQAEVWAKRLAPERDAAKRIAVMFRQAYARPPSAGEVSAALAFLGSGKPGEAPSPQAWTDLAHVLFNTKEFIFVQ